MARRPPTEAQKAERGEQLEALHAQIAFKVADLTGSEQWQAWLRVASRFHQYSFNNTILIWTQRPDATQVAGYTIWQKSFHRQVTRGEHGIRIFAPVTRRLLKTKLDGTPVLDDKGKPVRRPRSSGSNPPASSTSAKPPVTPSPNHPDPPCSPAKRVCQRNGVSGSIAREGRRSHDDRDNHQQQLVGRGVGQTGSCDPNTTPAGAGRARGGPA